LGFREIDETPPESRLTARAASSKRLGRF